MKYIVTSIFLSAVLLRADMNSTYHDAIRNGAEAKYVYRVVDDEGQPVSDATAHVWFKSYGRPQDNAEWEIQTDQSGVFQVVHRVNERFCVGIDKEGFYHAHDEIYYLGDPAPAVENGKWQPYGEERVLVLKKIRTLGRLTVLPGHMRMGRWPIPCQNQWVGFDLELMDWVPPYGQGRTADYLAKFSSRVNNGISDYCYKMDVCFTNMSYAGAYVKTKDRKSDLEWNTCADTNSVYQTKFSFVREKGTMGVRREEFLDDGKYLVYRVRTKVNEKGELTAAHYGVISGRWAAGSSLMVLGDTVFNPIENDVSIEDSLFLREKVRYREVSRRKEVKLP